MPTSTLKWRSVALIMSTALCVGLSIGLFPALLALNVDARGYATSLNGMLAALHGVAGLCVAPFVPRLMARFGGLRTYVAASVAAAVMVSLFVVFQEIEVWFVLRFILGLCLGVQWVVSETWMNQIAVGPRRGVIISIYVVILSLGLALGPLIMAGLGTQGPAPFLVTSGLLVLSALPLSFLGSGDTGGGHAASGLGWVASLMRKPSVLLAALVDGFVFQAFMAFLPIYFLRLGASEVEALGMLNAFFIGGIVMQVVIGYLMDRISPAAILLGSCLSLLVGLLIISQPGLPFGLLWFVLFAMGGPAAAIFTAGLAGLNDAFTVPEMASGSAAFTMVWHVGGLTGPALAGLAMGWWDPFGFSLVVGISLAVLALANGMALGEKARR